MSPSKVVGLAQPTGEEIAVDGIFLPSEHANAYLRFWIVKTPGEPIPFGVKNVGESGLFIAVAAFDGAGKDPRMAAQDRQLSILFEMNF
jgi:hypothetical protein